MTALALVSNGPPVRFRYESFTDRAVFRCNVVLTPEEDGGFSAECTNLPGVISEGDTEEEAIANVAEAFRETIRYYVSEGLRVPFGPVGVDNCHGCLEKTMDVSI